MSRHASVVRWVVGFSLLMVVAATALAADPNGTWTWKQAARGGRGGRGGGGGGGGGAEISLVLKAEGEKLTGKITLPAGRGGGDPVGVEIKNGTFKNDEVSFETEREARGNKITTKYKGKVEGDKITGKSELDLGGAGGGGGGRGGAGGPQDWVADRKK